MQHDDAALAGAASSRTAGVRSGGMTLLAVDSTHHLDPAVLHQHGVVGIIRYAQSGSKPSWKSLLPAELALYRGAGIAVGLVWEVTSNQVAGGYAQGAYDCRVMSADLDALGFPRSVLACWSCDEDIAPELTDRYADGWHAVAAGAGRDSDVYGSAGVIDRQVARGTVRTGWQAEARAWSHDTTSPNADVIQTVATSIPDTDGDTLSGRSRLLWWPGQQAPAPAWHQGPFPGNMGEHLPPNPAGCTTLKLEMLVAGYGSMFAHSTRADWETYGPGTTAAFKLVQQAHDIILLIAASRGDKVPASAYWERNHQYTGVCGELGWSFLGWLIENLPADHNLPTLTAAA